jgi:hypothetical protein
MGCRRCQAGQRRWVSHASRITIAHTCLPSDRPRYPAQSLLRKMASAYVKSLDRRASSRRGERCRRLEIRSQTGSSLQNRIVLAYKADGQFIDDPQSGTKGALHTSDQDELMVPLQFIRDSLEERFISMGLMTSTRLDVNPQGMILRPARPASTYRLTNPPCSDWEQTQRNMGYSLAQPPASRSLSYWRNYRRQTATCFWSSTTNPFRTLLYSCCPVWSLLDCVISA